MNVAPPPTEQGQNGAADETSDTADTLPGVAPTISASSTPKFSRKRRSRSPKWRWFRIFLAVAVLAAAGTGVYLWQSSANATSAQTTIALPVTKGDLSVTVESSGKVQATSQASVTYETSGEVVEVLVKEGDKVQAGQPLVRLSDHDQKLAIQEAEAALNTAQAKLDDLKKGSSQADIKSAQADVQAAQADLAKVKSGATKKEIADAEADLRSAQANLEQVKKGATPNETADAEADLKAAQAKLDDLKKPASASEVAAAQADLKAAQTKLADLKAGPTAAELGKQQSAVAQAETSLKKTQNDAALKKQEAELALAKADRDLQQAQRDYGKIADDVLDENGKLTVASSDPRYDQYWKAYNTLKDAEAEQKKALAMLENVRQDEIQDVAKAQAELDTARKTLDDLRAGPTASELADAQATISKAQKALDSLTANPSSDDLATAQANVTKAQTKLDELKAGPAQDKLAQAQSDVDKAQNKLNELRAGPTRADVASAEAGVAQKQADLQKLLEPASASEIAAAEETVAKARKSLDEANQDLARTVLHAPFSGVVADVSAEAHAIATAGKEAVSMYDPNGMHLDLDVSEGDIQNVKVGQTASITVDAIEGKTITGTVTSISPVATSGQDVVNYKVQVQFDPAKLPVRVGMSANAAITIQTKKGVLQVPNSAITTQGPFKTIKVMVNKGGKDTPVAIRVTSGITNGQNTEITGCLDTNSQCLRVGDRVAMTLPTATNNSQNGGDTFTFGAGPPPGGGVTIFGTGPANEPPPKNGR